MASGNVSEEGRGERTAYRICPLCEATCNLELTVKGDRITRVRGDRSDSFSRGFLCPKGASLGRLIEDPARLRQPMVRTSAGHVPVSWAEAWDRVRSGLAGSPAPRCSAGSRSRWHPRRGPELAKGPGDHSFCESTSGRFIRLPGACSPGTRSTKAMFPE